MASFGLSTMISKVTGIVVQGARSRSRYRYESRASDFSDDMLEIRGFDDADR
jgi:hypothetical protein